MPKSILLINKFDGGLVNYYDSKDIPEEALAEATGVMVDIKGKVRSMGGASVHALINDSTPLEGAFTPGYGLFVFNADYNISNELKESRMLIVQDGLRLGIYDTSLHQGEIILDSGVGISDVKPIFYAEDGVLRVADGSLLNDRCIYPRSYQFINKIWFYGIANFNTASGLGFLVKASDGESGDWFDLDSYIFPPSSVSGRPTDMGQLCCKDAFAAVDVSGTADAFGVLSRGQIALEVTANDSGDGEWDGDSAMSFGASFIYDDGQESTVTPFLNHDDDNLQSINTGSTFTSAGKIQLRALVGFGTYDLGAKAFDPRLKGVKFYWYGDSSGQFSDPLFLAYLHFGSDDFDKAYFESHTGEKQTDFTAINIANGFNNTGVKNTNLLDIKKLPAITYSLDPDGPGMLNDVETYSARWSSATIINRTAYIGGVKRVKFLYKQTVDVDGTEATGTDGNCKKQCLITELDVENDRILVSPVNKLDTFPSDFYIDVAINDGERITALQAFADRILQFKNKNLYIINISGDYEYLESEHRYLGVEHNYQVCLTEVGVAWVNRNGCYLYDGDKITNLITGKLNPTGNTTTNSVGWSSFIGENGMIGYLQELKQIVIFEDVMSGWIHTETTGGEYGDIMIYDLTTGSWTRGEEKVSSLPKSNIVMNYDNTCMFLTQNTNMEQDILFRNIEYPNTGSDAHWTIEDINGSWSTDQDTPTPAKLVLNGNDITNLFHYSQDPTAEYNNANIVNGTVEAFPLFLKRMIDQKINSENNSNYTGVDELIVNPNYDLDPTTFHIYRPAERMIASKYNVLNDTYANGALSISGSLALQHIVIAKSTIPKTGDIFTKKFDITEETSDWATQWPDIPTTASDYAVCISSVDETTGQEWLLNGTANTYKYYPLSVISQHCAMEGLFWNQYDYESPTGNDVWQYDSKGWTGETFPSNAFGDDVNYIQNPAECQIIVKMLNDSSIPTIGQTTFTFDTSLYPYGFWNAVDGLPNGWMPFTGAEWLESGHYSNFGYLMKPYLESGAGGFVEEDGGQTGIVMHIPKDLMGVSITEDGINGGGGALDFSDTGGENTWRSITGASQWSTRALKWEVPSVVFRVFNDGQYGRYMMITVLGDKKLAFDAGSVGRLFTISGCSKSSNNIANLKMDYCINQGIMGQPHLFENGMITGCGYGGLMNNLYGSELINTGTGSNGFSSSQDLWGDYRTITRIFFRWDQQTDAVKANWEDLQSYGDHNTVTFTFGSTGTTIPNSGNPIDTGYPAHGHLMAIHPRRYGDFTEGTNFSWILRGNDSVQRDFQYTTSGNQGDESLTISIIFEIYYMRNGMNSWIYQDNSNSHDWEAIYGVGTGGVAEAYGDFDDGVVNISGSGLVVKFKGNHLNILESGDVISFNTGGASNVPEGHSTFRQYRIKNVDSYTLATNLTQVTIASSPNDPWGGNTGINSPVTTNDGNTASGDYTMVWIFTSVGIVRGRDPQLCLSGDWVNLYMNGWCTLNVSVNEFNNGYGYNNNDIVRMTTRDIDFGSPSAIKALYKMIITYKGNPGVSVSVAFNGSSAFEEIGILDAASSWRTEDLYFNPSRKPIRIKSMQIKLSGPNTSDKVAGFEINDISVVYRSV